MSRPWSLFSSRYSIKKVYVIVCRTCDENITRSLTGEDVTILEDTERTVREHEEVFHPDGR